jgi:hypothetical protein
MEHEDRTFGLEGCAREIRAGTRPTVSHRVEWDIYALACMIVAALALELFFFTRFFF